MSEQTNIIAVHVAHKWALTESGHILDMTDFFDEHGEDTKDLNQAVIALAQAPGGEWLTIDLRAFGDVELLN